MTGPAAAGLLDAWERGRDAPPSARGPLLLALAEPHEPCEALAGWSVGRRDAALLALRERTFGPRVAALASCPGCGEAAELELAIAELLVPASPEAPAALTLADDGYRVTFRLPTAGDLASLGASPDARAAERRLLELCVVEARREGEEVAPAELPEDVVAALGRAMADADPQADVELAAVCPACGNPWTAAFDVVGFLWLELDAWAPRILREVSTLAAAFGWSEGEILALSPWRRRRYLELAGA